MQITGKEISYLYICGRKLWFFCHGLRPEMENDNVIIGMLLNDTAFRREEKDIPIGDVGVIDWAAFRHGVIHETKKGRSPYQSDEAQVRYYLWWLNNNGIKVSEARIHYPKLRKTHTVKWNDDAEKQTELDIVNCRKLLELPTPPGVANHPYCKSCAYMELCYS